MIAASPLPLTSQNCPAIVGCVVRFVVPLRFSRDEGKQDRLQPGGRLSAAILPLVGRGAWAAKDADNFRRGNLGNGFLEGHGQIIPQKKKCAMQKIMLAMHTRKGHLSLVRQPHKKMTTTLLNSPNEAIDMIREIKPRSKKGFPAVLIMIDGESIGCTAAKAIKILETVVSSATFNAFTNAADTLTIKSHNTF
jgi:hypothetical protein